MQSVLVFEVMVLYVWSSPFAKKIASPRSPKPKQLLTDIPWSLPGEVHLHHIHKEDICPACGLRYRPLDEQLLGESTKYGDKPPKDPVPKRS